MTVNKFYTKNTAEKSAVFSFFSKSGKASYAAKRFARAY